MSAVSRPRCRRLRERRSEIAGRTGGNGSTTDKGEYVTERAFRCQRKVHVDTRIAPRPTRKTHRRGATALGLCSGSAPLGSIDRWGRWWYDRSRLPVLARLQESFGAPTGTTWTLTRLTAYGTAARSLCPAPVVKRISHRSPEPGVRVRFAAGAYLLRQRRRQRRERAIFAGRQGGRSLN